MLNYVKVLFCDLCFVSIHDIYLRDPVKSLDTDMKPLARFEFEQVSPSMKAAVAAVVMLSLGCLIPHLSGEGC